MLNKWNCFIPYDVMLKYICAKTIYDKFIKKCKYTQEMIEIKWF